MVYRCAVYGCKEQAIKGSSYKFYRFPQARKNYLNKAIAEIKLRRRSAWYEALRRPDITESQLSSRRICSKHFISGVPADDVDETNPDWIPSLHLGHKSILPPAAKLKYGKWKRSEERAKKSLTSPLNQEIRHKDLNNAEKIVRKSPRKRKHCGKRALDLSSKEEQNENRAKNENILKKTGVSFKGDFTDSRKDVPVVHHGTSLNNSTCDVWSVWNTLTGENYTDKNGTNNGYNLCVRNSINRKVHEVERITLRAKRSLQKRRQDNMQKRRQIENNLLLNSSSAWAWYSNAKDLPLCLSSIIEDKTVEQLSNSTIKKLNNVRTEK